MGKLICFLCFFFLAGVCVHADVTVVKQAVDANPKLYFRSITGNTEFSNYIQSDLKDCGWFDMVGSANDAQYVIWGRFENNKVYLNVKGDDSFAFAVRVDKGTARLTAKRLVDAVLKKLFNVPGICASRIAFVAQNGKIKEIYICDFNGTNCRKLTNNKSLSIDPNWGMADNMLTYTYYHNNYTDVVAYDVANRKTYRLAGFPGLNTGGAISPNGKYLAVILSRDKQVELYVKKVRGRGLKRLTHDKAVEGSPCWSPNGLDICFVSDKYLGRPRLYIININSGRTSPVNIVGSEALCPNWSAVSNKIVYSARFGKHYTLGVYDVKKGSSVTVKLSAAGNWMRPSWAPDGRHVVCARVLNYHSELYVVDTWTGKARQLLKSRMDLSAPTWSGLLR